MRQLGERLSLEFARGDLHRTQAVARPLVVKYPAFLGVIFQKVTRSYNEMGVGEVTGTSNTMK